MGFFEFINNTYKKLGDWTTEAYQYKSEYEKLDNDKLICMLKKHQYTNETQKLAIMSVLRDRGYSSKV